jgi:hypothetical protein
MQSLLSRWGRSRSNIRHHGHTAGGAGKSTFSSLRTWRREHPPCRAEIQSIASRGVRLRCHSAGSGRNQRRPSRVDSLMPSMPARGCRNPRCPGGAPDGGYCERWPAGAWIVWGRSSSRPREYTAKWDRISKAFLLPRLRSALRAKRRDEFPSSRCEQCIRLAPRRIARAEIDRAREELNREKAKCRCHPGYVRVY